ncbi:MAG: 3-oxoacyl-[acyl-carrier protein] reductase, partial [uncultured Solirubrobacteraceae bacterium]
GPPPAGRQGGARDGRQPGARARDGRGAGRGGRRRGDRRPQPRPPGQSTRRARGPRGPRDRPRGRPRRRAGLNGRGGRGRRPPRPPRRARHGRRHAAAPAAAGGHARGVGPPRGGEPAVGVLHGPARGAAHARPAARARRVVPREDHQHRLADVGGRVAGRERLRRHEGRRRPAHQGDGARALHARHLRQRHRPGDVPDRAHGGPVRGSRAGGAHPLAHPARAPRHGGRPRRGHRLPRVRGVGLRHGPGALGRRRMARHV